MNIKQFQFAAVIVLVLCSLTAALTISAEEKPFNNQEDQELVRKLEQGFKVHYQVTVLKTILDFSTPLLNWSGDLYEQGSAEHCAAIAEAVKTIDGIAEKEAQNLFNDEVRPFFVAYFRSLSNWASAQALFCKTGDSKMLETAGKFKEEALLKYLKYKEAVDDLSSTNPKQ